MSPWSADEAEALSARAMPGTFQTQESPPRRTLKLTLGYRGARFAGWARQPGPERTAGRPTVQGALEGALAGIFGQPVRTVAGGRTDAGVHAEGQVVSFETSVPIPVERLERALDARLPQDLWVVRAEEAQRGFDARGSARRRWYRYAICRSRDVPTGWRGRCLVRLEALDAGRLRKASQALLGTHDFAALATHRAQDAAPHRSTTRTVETVGWHEGSGEEARLLFFDVAADAFLRGMVRTMVGTLLQVGEGRLTEDAVAAILVARRRSAAGPSAPAHGLTLWRIDY